MPQPGSEAQTIEKRPPAAIPTAIPRVWLVFADQLTTRIFVECGIVDGLRARSPTA